MSRTLEILDMPVRKGSLMPVVWRVLAVEGGGSDARVHLTGTLIRALIMDDVPESINAAIPMSKIRGGVYFVQPGTLLVSAPNGSDWLRSDNDTGTVTTNPYGPGTRIPNILPRLHEGKFYGGPYVRNIDNHIAFFILASDTYAGKVSEAILRGSADRPASLQILVGKPASPRVKETLRSRGLPEPRQRARRYHPYVDEFEIPIMSEWTEKVPPIMPVPELMESESYTLIGFVSLQIPPHSIELRREHEIDTQPVLRSTTLHKSPRASTTHDWVMNFVVSGEDINTRLVPLLRQIDRCPFLPVTNIMLNEAGIFEVVVDQVEVSTMPDHPNSFQVTLAGRKFDTGGLGFATYYGLNFNWPLFKLYVDYLPRFLPVSLPMDGKVQILVPTDKYIADVVNRVLDDTRLAERLGFAPGSDTGRGIKVPPELLLNPGKGQFALLPLPDDQSRNGRYEVVVADSPSAFRQLAQAVLAGSVPGLEARSVSVFGGDVYISSGVVSNQELNRVLVNVDSGKQGLVKSALESVAFCWRLDSVGKVRTSDLDGTLARLLNASFQSAGRSVTRKPVSQGTPRASDIPEMQPFLPEGLNVVWQAVSVGFGNIVASLRRDVGDPIMQYLGKSDLTVVLQGVTDSEGLAALRNLFDRYIALAYMLRGISFIHPVRLNFQIQNEIARLMGIEEVVPISLEAKNIEGSSGVQAYAVTLTFVSMDPGGVQRRSMRRLSENISRGERAFNLTYSGLTASKELDRLYASLRRSELYPDLRLPTYGLLLDWCKTLAYQNGMMWDFVRSSLRGLALGLDESSFQKYLQEVSHHMKAFLNRIHESGLVGRMSAIPYVFADPDFFFSDGEGIGSAVRRMIRKELSAGSSSGVVFQDDTGVSGSIVGEDGSFEVKVHQSTQDLADSVRRTQHQTLRRHPNLYHQKGVDEFAQMTVNSVLESTAEHAGSTGDDLIASSSRQQIEGYKNLSSRFREAFAVPEKDLLLSYTHDVRDDSPLQQIAAAENAHVQGLQSAAQSVRQLEADPSIRGEPRPAGIVVDGVKQIIDEGVDSLMRQASKGSSRSFRLTNAATDPNLPITWGVTWRPHQYGLVVGVISFLGAELKPFLMGMFEQESSFNPQARSPYAYGLAQFTPSTFAGLLASGRYSVQRIKSGTIPSTVDYNAFMMGRWDLSSMMGIFYFLELIVDALFSISGKDNELRRDFVDYICAESPSQRYKLMRDPLLVLSGDRNMAKRLMVLGACLYNRGPGGLRSLLGHLASKARAGKSGPAAFDITGVDPGHGKNVYDKYTKWRGLFVSTVSSASHPKELHGAISPWISQQTNIEFTKQYLDKKSAVTNPTPSERASGTGDPFNDVHNLKNFPLLPLTGWADMARYQPHGRLIQCFPTYCLLLVQGGRWVRWVRFWDHFYGLFSVMSIDVHKSRESPQHTAEIILSNSYRQLSNLPVTQAYAQAVIAGMRPFQHVQGEELFRGGGPESQFIQQLVKSIQNQLFPLLGDYERHVWNQEMKALFLHPGERIHLRIGYGADAASLPVVFNGTIASVDIQGSTVRLLALGDGREFLKDIATEGQPYKNSNLLGQTVEIRNVIIDMLVSRRADSIPVVGPIVYAFSLGGLMNDSRFGIESFGRIETLAGSAALADAAAGNWSIRTFKILGMASMQASEGEVGVNIYNSQRDSGNFSIGMLPLLDTLTLGLSQMARNGDFIAIELKQGTIWDVFRNCQLAMLDALMSVEPFGLRSTLFFGRGHQALHYDYYNAGQLEALGVSDLASRIAFGSYWRIMRFKQYRQYHLAVSEWNLISNELIATTERMWNEVQSFDAQGVPGNKFTFDPAVVPEDRKPFYFHSALSTTLMSQLSLGAESNWVSVLARIGVIRSLIGERLGIAMPIRAVNNVSANLVREGVSYMYDGSMVLAGAAEIKPNDMIIIDDQMRAMQGTVIVREVEHHFSTQHGYSSLIVPDACVLGNGDIDTVNLVNANRMAYNMVLFYRLRSDLKIIYRAYLFMLLNVFGFAFARVRYLTQKIPAMSRMMDRLGRMIGALGRAIRPTVNELIGLLTRAVKSSYGIGKNFFGVIFHGAWTIDSLKKLWLGIVMDSRIIYGGIVGRSTPQVVEGFTSIIARLSGLGASRPLLNVRTLGTAVLRSVAGRTNLIMLVGNTVLEMVNRKLSSYYPCRLYPVMVNGLPLTAGIRGHFGTVQGDSMSPLQTVLDVATLHTDVSQNTPAYFKYARDFMRVFWPLHRPVPARVDLDEELAQTQKQFELRSRYNMMGIYGSVSEIYGGASPTLREGPDDRVERRRDQQFRRAVVGYARNDDPSKGDYLFDFMDQRAAFVLRDLVRTLRQRGVQIAIHQGRRSLEDQQRLHEMLEAGKRSKTVARPTPDAPHVAGRAIDVQYRHSDGTFRPRPPQSQESIILQVVQEMNRKYAPVRIRWLGDRSKYSGSVYEPWHFDVSFMGG